MDSRRLDLPGGTFDVLAEGPEDGELVVCLHGFPDHARSWEGLLSRLGAAGYRAVAPWLRGYAPSTLEGPFDMARIASDTIELADALSPDRPALLVGHDWGAAATFQALGLRPDRFRRAVTLAVPHPAAWLANPSQAQLRMSWYMLFFQLRGISDWWVTRDDLRFIDQLWKTWSPGYRVDPQYMAELKRCLWLSMPGPLAYYRAMFAGLANPKKQQQDLDTISGLEVPTLHLHGADDGCVLYATGRGQERFFRSEFESVEIPRAGHFLHLEQPEVVARHILDWLATR